MRMHRSLNDFWVADRGLAWVLTLLMLAIFLILPMVHELNIATLIFTILLAAILLSGIRAMGMSGLVLVSGYLLAAGCVLSHMAVFFLSWPHLDAIELALNVVALCFLDGIIIYRVFSPGPINANRIMGAIAVYLVAGLVFAAGYELVESVFPSSLEMAGQAQHLTKENFVYFSFATLTTVGYGDIIPLNPFSRSLAMLEALIGQLYPAIFIGALISLISERKAR